MKSKSRKRFDIVKWRQEVEFVNHWPSTFKPEQYNALTDKHNLYYFQLPSIQKHLKKLRKKANKEQNNAEKQALLDGLDRNSVIFGWKRKRKAKSVIESLAEREERERETESLTKLKRSIDNGRRSMSTKRLYQISESMPGLSLDKKFPAVQSAKRESPSRVRTERESSIERYNVMEQIIKRRLGTTLQ